MTKTNKTPEQWADQLREAIEYEIQAYGVRSLAAVIATILEEQESPDVRPCFAPMFRRIEEA